jgi:hypothetical protein
MTTYILGRLLIHSFSCTESKFAAAYQKFPASGLLRIWPILNDESTGLPGVSLEDNDVDELADVFAHAMPTLAHRTFNSNSFSIF